MNDISKIVQSRNFTQILLRSLPCALLVFDQRGNLYDMNNAEKRIFGTRFLNNRSKPKLGSLLKCLYAYEKPDECGSIDACNHCEVRKLALSSIAKNKLLESTTHFKIIDKGHVKDTLLLVTAKPCEYREKKYSLVSVERLSSNDAVDSGDTQEGFHGIVGQNKKMLELFETIQQIRSSNDPVLLQGESGTGKELVAMAIHRESVRAGRHFVPVNCGALPEGLLESEMFGHIKGAFTGANFNKKGRFKVADRGTIFLDEVSELNPSMQAKFLRVIETGCYEPVGSDQQVTVDARVISATNSLLEKEIEKGRFRSDLYYRLCVLPILLPALRDRRDDISLLSDFFLKKFAMKTNQQKLKLSKEALSILENYSWPGNVRELQNVLKYSVLKCQGELITPEHFPYYLFQSKIHYVARRRRKLKLDVTKVSEALRQTKGNKRWAAEKLGVSRSTLYRFFDKQKT